VGRIHLLDRRPPPELGEFIGTRVLAETIDGPDSPGASNSSKVSGRLSRADGMPKGRNRLRVLFCGRRSPLKHSAGLAERWTWDSSMKRQVILRDVVKQRPGGASTGGGGPLRWARIIFQRPWQ